MKYIFIGAGTILGILLLVGLVLLVMDMKYYQRKDQNKDNIKYRRKQNT